MTIITTIIPIFAVIGIGWLCYRKGFIPDGFVEPANKLVFYLAIPALVFKAIATADLKTNFDLVVLLITLFAVIAGFGMAYTIGTRLRIVRPSLGAYIQTSSHGNLGYIGLAVTYYYLGQAGFVRAGILTGFIMILQNLLAVFTLLAFSNESRQARRRFSMARGILANPVILSAMAGILWSLSGWTLPAMLERSLGILSGMALPLALLIIGASLSFDLLRIRYWLVLSVAANKLLLLPALAFVLYRLAGVATQDYLPGLILLASPTATVCYVMAKEMKGDPELSAAAISAATLLSSLSFTLWLAVSG